MSLEYYNYDTAAVINAVLENSLPLKLKELKELGPSEIPNATPIYTVWAFYYLKYDRKINVVNTISVLVIFLGGFS